MLDAIADIADLADLTDLADARPIHAIYRTRRAAIGQLEKGAAAMQELLDDYRKRRRDAEDASHADVTFGAGVAVPLARIAARRLDELQLALTRTPRSPIGQPQAVEAYRLSEGVLHVPRCFGLARFPGARDACSDGAALSPGAVEATEHGLRPHQAAPASAALAALASRPYSAVLCLPCGAGKTVVALHVARALGRRFLVVVSRGILLDQWVERLSCFMPKASVGVARGRRREFGRDATVATIQTLARLDAREDLSDVGFVVIDEAHHFAARLFSEVFYRVPARHVLGLSATPERRDGLTELLGYYMGEVLVFEGARSVRGEVLRVVLGAPDASRLSPLELQRRRTALASDAARNVVIVEVVRAASARHRRTLLLSDRVAHLEALRRSLPEAFVISAGSKERPVGDCGLIFATFGMASEGFDFPNLDCLVLAAACSDVTQAVGRVLRAAEGKRDARVVDVVDGGPFFGSSLARRRQYLDLGFEVRDAEPTPGLREALESWMA